MLITRQEKPSFQERFEFSACAFLPVLSYKCDALTDCATKAWCLADTKWWRARNNRKISTLPTLRNLCYDGRVDKAFALKSNRIFPRRCEGLFIKEKKPDFNVQKDANTLKFTIDVTTSRSWYYIMVSEFQFHDPDDVLLM